MEHAMDPIESQIANHDNGRDLHPIGQTADQGLNGCRDNPCGGKNDPNNNGQQTKLCQYAIQEQKDHIVAPIATKNLLLRMHGKQPLERHKHKKNDKNNLEAKGIHRGSSPAVTLSLFTDGIKSKPAAAIIMVKWSGMLPV